MESISLFYKSRANYQIGTLGYFVYQILQVTWIVLSVAIDLYIDIVTIPEGIFMSRLHSTTYTEILR